MAVPLRKKLVYNHVKKSISLGLCLCYLDSLSVSLAFISLTFEEFIFEAVDISFIIQ